MRRGFNLIELAMTTAIVSTLAALAIPLVADTQVRAKRAEVGLLVSQIQRSIDLHSDALGAHWGDTGGFVPALPLGRRARPWQRGTEFDEIGVQPDGWVYCSYGIGNGGGSGLGYTGTVVTVEATCDLDGDGVPYFGLWARGDSAVGGWAEHSACEGCASED